MNSNRFAFAQTQPNSCWARYEVVVVVVAAGVVVVLQFVVVVIVVAVVVVVVVADLLVLLLVSSRVLVERDSMAMVRTLSMCCT